MNADISDAETEIGPDSAELANMVGTNPELDAMPELLEEGREIAGRYRIVRHLGSGGMGHVYLAEHTAIGKQVALKTLSVEFARRRVLRERFLREARSASQIRHPNVVDITDFGSTDEGAPFIAMEYLDGEDLKDLLEREKRLPFERTRGLIVQVCRALQAAHDQGIVHRDVKPANCFCIHQARGPDIVKVVDFGIAKTTAATGDSTELTKTGVIVGTAAYMSPEQARGESDLDARADVYSVGIILFRMLTGEMPYTASTPLGMITKHLTEPVPSVRERVPEAGLSRAVDAIVKKALAKDRDERFQSAAELADALENAEDAATLELVGVLAEPERRASPKLGLWLGVAAAVLIAGAGVAVLLGGTNSGSEAAAQEPVVEAQQGTEPAEAAKLEPPEPAPEPPVLEPEATTVAVKLSGAPEGARVIVAGEDLGPAGEPFELPRGDAMVSIEVQAEGYQSRSIAVVPLGDLELPAELEALASAGSKKKRPAKKTSKGSDTGKTKVDKEIGF